MHMFSFSLWFWEKPGTAGTRWNRLTLPQSFSSLSLLLLSVLAVFLVSQTRAEQAWGMLSFSLWTRGAGEDRGPCGSRMLGVELVSVGEGCC